MTRQVTRSAIVSIVFFAVALLMTVWFSTGTINPLAVYTRGGLSVKIAVAVLALLFCSSALQLLGYQFMRATISRAANMPADDIICPGCGLPLLAFISSHGMPIRCVCKKWWHSGAVCLNRDSPSNQRLIRRCPDCVAEASLDHDLVGDING